jgi:hypothetical protein
MDDPRHTLEIEAADLALLTGPTEPDIPAPAHNTGRPVSRRGAILVLTGLVLVAALLLIGYQMASSR